MSGRRERGGEGHEQQQQQSSAWCCLAASETIGLQFLFVLDGCDLLFLFMLSF